MAVSCFTRTIKRELDVVDFSWATFRMGTCLLQARRSALSNIAAAFFSQENTFILSSLFLAIFIFANVIWLAEGKVNPDFRGDGSYSDGVWHGMWFTVVTFTTVGYGEKTPITNVGKVVVMMWMAVGLGFYCLFTGTLAAYLTNSGTQPAQYGWDSLRLNNQLKVACVEGSSTLAMARDKGINVRRLLKTNQAAYGLLESGEIDVMLTDWPIVLGDMRRGLISSTDFVCYEKSNDDSYGFAFPNNAVLRPNLIDAMTKLNAGLITWDKSKQKDDVYAKYFPGETSPNEDPVQIPPKWTVTTIIAFTVALCLVMGWSLVALKKHYAEYLEKERRKANGEPEEEEDETLIGGMAKAKDLNTLMAKVESIEARLVESQVIKPKPNGLDRWKKSSQLLKQIRRVDSPQS